MQCATVAYNTFAMSTLLYVAQLEAIPDYVLQEERTQVVKMFPGPGVWVIPEDLWYLKEHFGLAKSAQSLAMVARAAKLRVATLGCHFGCRFVTPHRLRRLCQDNIFSRAHDLQHAMIQTNHLDRISVWGNWFRNNFCKVLVENTHWLKGKGIVAQDLFKQFAADERVWTGDEFERLKKGFQRVAHVAIKNLSAGHPSTRIRAKVERWRDMEWGITGHPGVYSRQIARRLGMLSGLVTPRVQAAVFVTLWNGWCTHRRFQRRLLPSNRCVLGCIGGAEDAIEHYCRCPTILRVARHTLKFSYAVQGALDLWALNNSWLDDKDNLRVCTAGLRVFYDL